jgi:hypothetical protein
VILVGGGRSSLEPSDWKAQFFLVLIVLLWWFLGHACKIFGEMCKRL